MKQILDDVRSLCLLVWGTITTFSLIAFYLVVLIFINERKARLLERRLARMVLWSFGQHLSVEVLGDLSPNARVWIFNHSSFLDPFVVAAVIPDFVRGVGAHYHFRYPLWGRLLRKRGIIPIVRDDHKKALAAIKAGEEILRAGDALIVAPEGTRNADGEILPFKGGAFHAAINTGADMVVIVINGAHLAWPRGSWRVKSMTIEVEFAVIPASSIEHLADADMLKKYARSIMKERLADMRRERGPLRAFLRREAPTV